MNHQLINIILLIGGILILLRGIYRIKKQNLVKPFELIAAVLLIILAGYALITNSNINDIKTKIEQLFSKQ